MTVYLKQDGRDRVLLIPAHAPKISGKAVHFLFTLGQVKDIFRKEVIRQIPFAPSWVMGLTRWREKAVPVICLEDCLGMPFIPSAHPGRMVLIRSREQYAVLYADTALRLVHLPETSAPPESVSWISEKNLVRGVYECKEGFLVLADMPGILNMRQKQITGE